MAFRSQKAIGSLILALFFSSVGHAQSDWIVDARHDHWRGECKGVLSVTEQGVSFTEAHKKKKASDLHQWTETGRAAARRGGEPAAPRNPANRRPGDP